VIVSGSTVAVGLLSMITLPLPFIRSIGIGGMLIPAVSVIAAITLQPAQLAVLGTRVNSVRKLPRRLVDTGHPEDGAWGRWARLVMRRPAAIAAIGLVIVGVLVSYGVRLNPSEAQAKDMPGSGDAIAGRRTLADAGISPGVLKPFVVLVRHGADPQPIAAKLRATPGIAGAAAPPAFAALVRRNQTPVRRFLRRLCGDDWSRADDLAQETFWKAWRHIGSFRGDGRFLGWLFRIAWQLFVTQQRSRRDVVHEPWDDARHATEDASARIVDRHTLDQLLRVLRDEERAAIILHYRHDLTQAEIAEAMELPLGTVKTLIRRARQKLQQAFESSPARNPP
jgi:RNA polymerase sigma factor (sigma-70 family)